MRALLRRPVSNPGSTSLPQSGFSADSAGRPRAVVRPLVTAALIGLVSCANLEFARETQTSGTFHASALAFTIITVDIPRSAIDAARENVTDARQPNVIMTRATVWPYLGPVDWLLDIIGIRYAVISGTWGFLEE